MTATFFQRLEDLPPFAAGLAAGFALPPLAFVAFFVAAFAIVLSVGRIQ